MSEFINTEAEKSTSVKKPKTFRLNTQTLFLTYPKCKMTPEQALEQLQLIVKIEVYLIAQEQHMDGTMHLHAYLRLDHKMNIKDERKFDLRLDGELYHPNMQGARSPKAVIKYVCKDGKYVTNMSQATIDEAIHNNVKVGDLYKEAMEKAKESFEEGMKVLEHSKTFRDLAIHGEAIERNMRARKKQKTEPKFSLDLFKVSFEWDKTKTLVLWGPTNTGKTSLAKALLPNALFIRHIDALKEYKTGQYTGLIFDDMSFKHWPREAQIHLLDTDNVSQINVKHSIAIIPEGTPRIITTNMMPAEILALNIMSPEECALSRRVQLEWIEKRVY
jgi:hypothetical protein